MRKSVDQIIVDIIARELTLPKGRAWVRDQNVLIPEDEDLFVIAGMINVPQTMAVNTEIQTKTLTEVEDGKDTTQTLEVQKVQMREDVQIDIMSRNDEALNRRWEVLAALGSIYSSQIQELNNFKIFKRGNSFVNTSSAEGGSQLKRYSITIPCFTWYKKEKILLPITGDYYDDFTTRVDDEKTIGTPSGIFEFEITPETTEP